MIKTIYIFDIDGCIMPEIFPQLKDDDQTLRKQQKIIKKANKKGYKIKVYSYFTEYFSKIENKDNIFFLTGRKFDNFGKLTYIQLMDYIYWNNNNIPARVCFYPKNGNYTKKYYFDWKYYSIINIIDEYSKILIFDDKDEYFNKLINLKKFNITCYKIDGNNSWKELLND